MVIPSLLKELAEEKVVLLKPSISAKIPFPLDTVVRLVDTKGNTIALILDKKTLEEIEEELEAQNPEFLASLEESRKSGRVSGSEVKKKAGLK
ncbi:MAG: hypothetical protein QXN56_06215 [Candidatus Hadarchaeum sp.]